MTKSKAFMSATRNVTQRAIFTTCTVVVFLSGCGESVNTTTGEKPLLSYMGRSDTDLSLSLVNVTGDTVSVRGGYSSSLSVVVWSGDYEVVCETVPPSKVGEDPFGSAHGNPRIFEVPARKSRSLIIRTALPNKFPGGICRVRLQLIDGTIIGPVEFSP